MSEEILALIIVVPIFCIVFTWLITWLVVTGKSDKREIEDWGKLKKSEAVCSWESLNQKEKQRALRLLRIAELINIAQAYKYYINKETYK